jgi:alpha-ribazole phosphatase
VTRGAVTRVDFLRHGATEAGDVLLGRTDAPLSASGRETLARALAGRTWDGIVTSPLKRARETAAIAANGDDGLIAVDDAWREIDFGDWDGRLHASLATDTRLSDFYRDPDANPPPGGETMESVRARLTPALERLDARGQGPVLIVAHGGTIRMAMSLLLAIPFARLWAIRIAPAARISIEMGIAPVHGLWGEIVEIAQPREPAP